MTHRPSPISLIFIAILLATCSAAPVQAAASLHISAADPSGARIAGASVALRNEATGAVTSSSTGPDGTFAPRNLPPGIYDVSVTMKGFVDFQQNAIRLADGQDLGLQATLKPTSEAQSVTVTAEGSPETSVTQATISRAEIDGVAGPFGSAAQALTAVPGVFV